MQNSQTSVQRSESKGRAKKRETIQQIADELNVEILIEGQECPYCRFSELKREEDQIVCPVCGYGRKACT